MTGSAYGTVPYTVTRMLAAPHVIISQVVYAQTKSLINMAAILRTLLHATILISPQNLQYFSLSSQTMFLMPASQKMATINAKCATTVQTSMT